MYLFACKTLTIVKDVEFQVNFSRYFSARDRPAQQEKDVLSFSPVVTTKQFSQVLSLTFLRYRKTRKMPKPVKLL